MGESEELSTHTGFQIEFSELNIEAKIGSGSFGDVYLGSWRNTPVAIKRLRRNLEEHLAELKKEASTMLQLR
jgi:predicted Ser/Thr protein kinase